MRFRLRALLRDPEPAPGGGGGAPPAPAPAPAPGASSTPTIDYGEIAKLVAAQVAEALKAGAPSPSPSPAPGASPQPDPKFAELQKSFANQQKELEAMRTRNADTERRSEEKDRHAQISTILSEFQFASPEAAAAARSLFAGQISRVKDGEALVGPDGTTPFDKYLRDSIEGPQSFFLAPKNVSGAGAGNPTGRAGGKTINAEDIKPGMSKEDLAAAGAQIAALMR
jgi:hypothetical protein